MLPVFSGYQTTFLRGFSLVAECLKGPLSIFKSRRAGYELVYYWINNRRPSSQKEHIEDIKKLKFGLDQANIEQDTATWKFNRDVWIAGHIFWTSIYFLVNFRIFEWSLIQYRPGKHQTWECCLFQCALSAYNYGSHVVYPMTNWLVPSPSRLVSFQAIEVFKYLSIQAETQNNQAYMRQSFGKWSSNDKLVLTVTSSGNTHITRFKSENQISYFLKHQ